MFGPASIRNLLVGGVGKPTLSKATSGIFQHPPGERRDRFEAAVRTANNQAYRWDTRC